MNENPWRIDEIARFQRARIREEMTQIRLVEEARRAQVKGPGKLARAWQAAGEWLEAWEIEAMEALAQSLDRHAQAMAARLKRSTRFHSHAAV